MEELMISDGKVATANFGEYKIPTIKDVPPFKSSVTEQPHGAATCGAIAMNLDSGSILRLTLPVLIYDERCQAG